MNNDQAVRHARSTMQTYQTPMLCLYIDLDNDRAAATSPHAMAGIRSTLEELPDIPRPVVDAVLSELHRTNQDLPTNGIAIFANEDALDIIPMDMPLPMVDPRTGRGEARWGHPYIAPLMAIESHHRPHCVVFVDSDRFRAFLVRGQKNIEEVCTRTRTPSPQEGDELTASKQIHPAYVATRGGAAYDQARQHTDIQIERFHQATAADVHHILEREHHASLIVLGPARELARLERVWPHALVEEISARLPSLPDPDAPAAQVLDRVADTIDELERCRQDRLLERLPHHGCTGLATCLRAIQAGRIHTAMVPWPLTGTVFRDEESDYFATTPEDAREFSAHCAPLVEVGLDDALVALAREYDVRLEFMTGDHRRRLEREFDGIGGLFRW